MATHSSVARLAAASRPREARDGGSRVRAARPPRSPRAHACLRRRLNMTTAAPAKRSERQRWHRGRALQRRARRQRRVPRHLLCRHAMEGAARRLRMRNGGSSRLRRGGSRRQSCRELAQLVWPQLLAMHRRQQRAQLRACGVALHQLCAQRYSVALRVVQRNSLRCHGALQASHLPLQPLALRRMCGDDSRVGAQ